MSPERLIGSPFPMQPICQNAVPPEVTRPASPRLESVDENDSTDDIDSTPELWDEDDSTDDTGTLPEAEHTESTVWCERCHDCLLSIYTVCRVFPLCDTHAAWAEYKFNLQVLRPLMKAWRTLIGRPNPIIFDDNSDIVVGEVQHVEDGQVWKTLSGGPSQYYCPLGNHLFHNDLYARWAEQERLALSARDSMVGGLGVDSWEAEDALQQMMTTINRRPTRGCLPGGMQNEGLPDLGPDDEPGMATPPQEERARSRSPRLRVSESPMLRAQLWKPYWSVT